MKLIMQKGASWRKRHLYTRVKNEMEIFDFSEKKNLLKKVTATKILVRSAAWSKHFSSPLQVVSTELDLPKGPKMVMGSCRNFP